MRWFVLPLAVLALHCSSTPTVEPSSGVRTSYVGQVGKTNVKMALVLEDGNAALFFCGAQETQKSHTIWFRGASAESSFDSKAPNGASVHVDFNEDSADGTLTQSDGTKLSFSVPPSAPGSVADLYEAKDATGVAGVVVVGEREVQGVFIAKAASGSESPTFQITPLSPAWTRSDDGVQVQYAVGKNARLLRVYPVRPAQAAVK
jgi:hypothetical protein